MSFYEFSCPTCSESFKNDTSLRDHEIRIHGNRGKIVKCPYSGCNKDFTNPAILRNHVRTHTDERPFSCPFCECKFKAKFHMENHRKRHTKTENQFLCLHCAQTFNNPDALIEHGKECHEENIDTRYYDCQKCASKFQSQHLLNEHFNKEHAYECEKCHLKFVTHFQLQCHEKTHFTLVAELDITNVETIKIEDFIPN